MKKMLITDLDRTLLRDDNSVSAENYEALKRFRKKGNLIAVATGRNIFSVNQVLKDDFPIDFLIFSSGVGIMNWAKKKIIYENHLNENEIKSVIKILISHKVDFMVHDVVPYNHKFFFWKWENFNPDFERRLKLYEKHCQFLKKPQDIKKASQFIVILSEDSITKFNEIKSEIKFLKVIRATSPLDHKSIWLEIFPRTVSKGKAAKWLCNFLLINKKNTIGIGNDYNDIDLLDWTTRSYVVENAPEELKRKYTVTDSNEKNGFAKVVMEII